VKTRLETVHFAPFREISASHMCNRAILAELSCKRSAPVQLRSDAARYGSGSLNCRRLLTLAGSDAPAALTSVVTLSE